jgi:hypothetical protein
MEMITPNFGPVYLAPTVTSLEGPWAVARGLELPEIPPVAKTVLTLGSAVASAYHGTRRNDGSVFWGVVWFALGAVFPVLTPAVGYAQGFGQRRPATCPSPQVAGLMGAAVCRSRRRRRR